MTVTLRTSFAHLVFTQLYRVLVPLQLLWEGQFSLKKKGSVPHTCFEKADSWLRKKYVNVYKRRCGVYIGYKFLLKFWAMNAQWQGSKKVHVDGVICAKTGLVIFQWCFERPLRISLNALNIYINGISWIWSNESDINSWAFENSL